MQAHLSIPQQVPDFVRADYPAFVEFLQAYYKWLEEEYSAGDLADLVDIDETVDDFLQYFRKELDVHGVTNNTTDRFYIRHLKELYTAKGSDQAFQLLFKILYNTESTTHVPWDVTFIPSAARWRQMISVLVGMNDEDAATLLNSPLTITDDDGNTYTVIVEHVVYRDGDVVEIFFKRFRTQAELVSVATEGNAVTGNIISTLATATVLDGGSGFTAGQEFTITYAGDDTIIRITDVDSNGTILGVEIIRFGTGYTTDATVILSPSGSAEISVIGFRPSISVELTNNTITLHRTADMTLILGDMTIVTADVVSLPHGLSTGQVVTYDNGGGTSIAPLDHLSTLYYAIVVDSSTIKLATTYENAMDDIAINLTTIGTGIDHSLHVQETNNVARILLSLGSMLIYPGYWSGSVLGDGQYIEDSYYYQVYSYVTRLDEELAKYKTIMQRVLHPTGTKHFAIYQQTNEVSFTPTIELAG